jgi:methionine-rich copper-binding protein CopC
VIAGAVAAMLVGFPAVLPLFPRPAAAHAIVLESEPSPDAVLGRSPARVVLRFNSKIEKRLTRVTLTAGRGTPISLPIAAADAAVDRVVIPLRELPPGSYVLRYKVLSADGHITEGALRFTVDGGR